MTDRPGLPPGVFGGTGGGGRTEWGNCVRQESRRPLRFTTGVQRPEHAGRPAGHRSRRRPCRRTLSYRSVLRCRSHKAYITFRTHQHCGVGRAVPRGAAWRRSGGGTNSRHLPALDSAAVPHIHRAAGEDNPAPGHRRALGRGRRDSSGAGRAAMTPCITLACSTRRRIHEPSAAVGQ